MIIDVYIQPHERHEAIDAYGDRLTAGQMDEINDAPESAIVRLSIGVGRPGVTITVIEEG